MCSQQVASRLEFAFQILGVLVACQHRVQSDPQDFRIIVNRYRSIVNADEEECIGFFGPKCE